MKTTSSDGENKPKPFRFRDGESVRHEIRRIARHELERILENVAEDPGTEEAIHEIRKGTKRLRTLLRLVRDTIGEKHYRRENRAFRDIGRAFSDARDAEVAEQSLVKLCADLRDELRPRALTSIRRALHARTRAAHKTARNGHVAGQVRRNVQRALARIDRWSRIPDKWSAVRDGLERIHRDTRRAWERALDDPLVETLHECRKRAKDLRYVMELLEPVWPEVIEALAREVERFESDLGEDHDLAMLPAHVSGDSVCPNDRDRDLVIALVDVRRRELQSRVRKTATRVCEERSRTFAARLGTYWKAWRREAG
jgi:CHAD domain-containing protein